MKFHTFKKGLSLFLSLSMIISLFTVSVSAQENITIDSLTTPQQTTTSGALDLSGKIILDSISIPESFFVPSETDWQTVTETILPKTLEGVLESSKETVTIPVTWVCDDYDSTQSDETMFTASAVLPENYTLKDSTKDLTVSILLPKTIVIDAEQNEFLIDSRNFSRAIVHPLPANITNYSGQLEGVSIDFYNVLKSEISGKLKESNGAVLEIPINGSFTFTDEADRDTKFNEYFQNIAQDFTDAFDAFNRDHPEIFWLAYPSYRLGYSTLGNTATLGNLKVTFGWDSDYTALNHITTDETAMNQKVQLILNAAAGKSDYDKLKYFHDWLTKNNRYNPYIADDSKDYDTLGTHKPWTAISAFLSQKSDKTSPVCEGYSRAFKLLCDKSGIPNFLVSGTGTGGAGAGAHMWNYVKLDGNWYAVDVTWDDPVINGNQDGDGRDMYFLKGSAFFNQNHTNDNGTVSVNGTSFAYPTLSANDYDSANPPATEYSVTVTRGTADKSRAKQGETITITADAPPNNQVFDKWIVSNGVTLADASKSKTTFTMPDKNVTVTATFKEPARAYLVTVNGGTSNKAYVNQGETVTITATIPNGKVFDKWTSSDGITFADAQSETTTFVMPAKAVTVTATFKDAPVNPPATEYSVTVVGGTADKTKAQQGETVSITATVPNGKVFDKWTSPDGISFADVSKSKTTFTMPDKNVTVTASFKDEPVNPPPVTEYSITVNGGTADKTKAQQGETVSITATIPEGKVFDKWTSPDGISFADASKSKTTFTMPDKNVTVTASFKDAVYSVTVNGGSSDKAEAKMNETVTLKAVVPTGKVFDKWTSNKNTVTFADASKSETTFIMPANDVIITALFKDAVYSVTVNGGSSNLKTAKQGDTVTINANPPAEGKAFEKWDAQGITFADEKSASATFTMPANDVTLTAVYKDLAQDEYAVVVVDAKSDKQSAKAGETVTVTANPAPSGKVFYVWTTKGITLTNAQIDSTSVTFTMPANNVTLTATYKNKNSSSGGGGGGGGGGSSSSNKPSVSTSTKKDSSSNSSQKGGTVTVASDNKTVTIKTKDGYEIEKIIVNGKEVAVSNKIVFDKVSKDNEIEVIFKKIEEEKEDTKKEDTEEQKETPNETTQQQQTPAQTNQTTVNKSFADTKGHWAEKAIAFAVEKGLFSGTSETTFSPDAAVTRGMFVTVLGRLANAQAQPNDKFSDVDKDAYYAGFVAWANEMGIVNGVSNEEFAPDNEITREQLAVMIYNYAKAMGMDISNIDSNKKDQLNDTDTISNWADDAISYCMNQGLLSGRPDGSFDPKGKASRAETATVLQKFVEAIK